MADKGTLFTRFAKYTARATGRPAAFILATSLSWCGS